jgi:hypothetical protein
MMMMMMMMMMMTTTTTTGTIRRTPADLEILLSYVNSKLLYLSHDM